jgi:hypothetical protein
MNPNTTPDLLTPRRADSARISEWAREVLEAEGRAILSLNERIGKEFERSIQILLEVQGQVLTSGVGKSGLVAKKIAATLTSTGTPANFVHPVDAIHGDRRAERRRSCWDSFPHSGGEAFRFSRSRAARSRRSREDRTACWIWDAFARHVPRTWCPRRPPRRRWRSGTRSRLFCFG